MLVAEQSRRARAALKSLPPLPLVAAKVSDLLANEPSSFQFIADTLETDAALSAEVLRLANSALTGVRYNVTSIVQALGLLGSRRVSTLVMTLSISKLLKRASKSESMRRLWRHNLACALAARHLAEMSHIDSNQAYLAGLFHDIGRLALLAQQPALYDEALIGDVDIDEMERRHFGVDHCEAGAWLIEEWKLPKVFAEAAQYHHNPRVDASEITIVVQLACQVADRLGFSLIPVKGEGELGPADEVGFSIALAVNSLEAEFGL